MEAKLDKLRQQLENLSQAHKVPRKALEQCLGLLIWATSISKHLRPWLAPLYSDLHSPPESMCSVSASTWQSFLSSLESTGHATRTMPGLWIPTVARAKKTTGVRACVAGTWAVVHKHQTVCSQRSVHRRLQCFRTTGTLRGEAEQKVLSNLSAYVSENCTPFFLQAVCRSEAA